MEINHQQVMKKFFLLTILLMIFSCGDIIEKPKNLIGQDKMAEVIAELATTDQLGMVTQNYNADSQTRFVFKKLNVNPKAFTDSYKFYIAKGKMEGIYSDAQDILKNKDEKGKALINKSIKEKDSASKAIEKQAEKLQKIQN